MANNSSAKKAIRKTARNAEINKNRKSRIKTYIKKVLAAVEAGSIEQAREAFVVAQSEIMRGVACSLIKKNTASRKVSRLSAKVKAIALNSDAIANKTTAASAVKAKATAKKASDKEAEPKKATSKKTSAKAAE